MLHLFSKKYCLSALALFCATSASLLAWGECDPCAPCNPCESNRMYIGGYGGWMESNSAKLSQMGTAFFTEAEGGPLAVFGEGHAKKESTGFGGVQVGYEWSRSSGYNECSSWNIAPAAELEAFFYCNKLKGHLINPSDRLPEHDFLNSFDTNVSVILANAVFSLNNSGWGGFSPYVGGGIGAAHISVKNAQSLQLAPVEVGINHFNSKRNDSSWAFAAQVKAGIRYSIFNSLQIFGEYRYLFVDSSNYIFGSTVYPTHAPTSPWNVKVNDMQYNAVVIGIQYSL